MNDKRGSSSNLFRFSSSFLSLSDHDLERSADTSLDFEVTCPPVAKSYDYTLKFLLVGDSDVGKEEILNGLNEEEEDINKEASFCGSPGVIYKSTVILLDGKRIRLQLWDASGQGRFSTIIRSYSRGAQGILLVYDITNKWSFSGLNRWLHEVEEHAPGVPKILLGNRLHLAFKRQINEQVAQAYAHKHNMSFFEVSPLCNYNIRESFTELSRIVLQRHGMESLWKHNTVLSLQELCCRAIVAQTTVYGIEQLPLPQSMKSNLKSFSTISYSMMRPFYHHHHFHHQNKDNNSTLKKKAKALFACDASGSGNRSRANSSKSNHHHQPVGLDSNHVQHSRGKSCVIS